MRILISTGFIFFVLTAFAQSDSIQHRLILIGDAGEIDPQQNGVIGNAANKIIRGKTTAIFLGDNVYPTGFGLPESKEEAETKNILRAQFQPMRNNGAVVYFIPGNHDWDRMGKDGLAKIKAQWSFITTQQDSLLQFLPPDGCPDPIAIDINDHLVIIAFDSEWWLFKHDKQNDAADCDCNNNDEVIAKMQELLYRNRYKTIILADHHPFKSYGHHGGYYGWKDHLFPFTAIDPNLYIPIPVAGSLYPILRKFLANPEDANHPLYKNMIKRMDKVFDTFPNLIHAAGHEHGMQFIKENDFIQLVSGAGAKEAFVKKGRYALFAQKAPGFIIADQMMDNSFRFTYYTQTDDSSFKNVFSFTKPYVQVKQEEEAAILSAPKDSITVQANANYDSVSNFHRKIFGENYRKEWAAPTTLPVIRISEIKGGLTPEKRGGGHQSYSLRLTGNDGKEWVLRSVNKYPEILLPESLRETFAANWVNDAMSAQHPYSALIVPPLANAVNVPHTNPVIGWVAPDKKLGIYASTFTGTVNLLEEREPLGKSDNTGETMEKLTDDNDNNFDSALFLRARLLDVLMNDWDRHNDQWRFAYNKNKYGGKTYTAVPRDRDQVFYVNEGYIPKSSTRPWLLWFMQDFKHIRNINDFMWESRFLNDRFLNQFSYNEWMNITNNFVANITDSVLEKSLQQLPASAYNLRHDAILQTLKNRRNDLPKQMDKYYHFFNKIVDIETSDKNELVEIKDTLKNNLLISIHKISKKGETAQQLFYKAFAPSITKEIRIYVHKGDDKVVFNTSNKKIKLRIIGKKGDKQYDAEQVGKAPIIYSKDKNVTFSGSDNNKLRKHLSNDSANTAFVATDLYNRTTPLLAAGYNVDDGVLLGAGFKYVHKGFRKTPWASVQQFTIAHSFSTKAFKAKYNGEWKDAVGSADFLLSGTARAPDNTQNFFGAGNETTYDKTGDFTRYYRARFNVFDVNAALRWGNKTSISVGPSYQFYKFDKDDNKGRFILNTSQLNTYDSATIEKDKTYIGFVANFISNTRNNDMMPSYGAYVNIKLQGFTGFNKYALAFMQVQPEISFYRSLTYSKSVVIADRIGGGITVGKPAFYQLLFLNGSDNMMGYRQYRYAGEQMLYNNLELRIKLANLTGYILPGEFGITGFYDVGRVWIKNEQSNKWHNGVGGGIYFTPGQLVLLRASVGYSTEGWYPYLSAGFRF